MATKPAFKYCLNTSTVRDKDGKSRPILELIDIAARAGYDAIEPWTSEIDEYVKTGGTLKELRKRIEESGLRVADVIGFSAGIRYGATLGHRGLTHSLFFAAVAAVLVVALWVPRGLPGVRAAPLAMYLALAMGSHGLLDALTDGGLGIALLWPVDGGRYFFPFRPIEVSPIGLRPFLSERGLAVLASELRWVWLPSAALALAALGVRRPWRLASISPTAAPRAPSPP